jgi:hypothetical protein
MSKAGLLLTATMAVAVVLTPVGLGTSAKVDKYNASLTAGQEVPKPTGVPKGASGKFRSTGREKAGKETLTWKLTFHNLSGRATAAHIHLGKRGKPGPVALTLCGPCKSGAHGTAKIAEKLDKALESGKAYVNVHTVKNPNGEIRGQIRHS